MSNSSRKRRSRRSVRRYGKKRYRQEAKRRMLTGATRARRFSSSWGKMGDWVEKTLP